jgi:hypothetical protein
MSRPNLIITFFFTLLMLLALLVLPICTAWALYSFLAPAAFWERLAAILACSLAALAQTIFSLYFIVDLIELAEK